MFRAVHRSKFERSMSALGQKQTSRHLQPMSALPPKADIASPRSLGQKRGLIQSLPIRDLFQQRSNSAKGHRSAANLAARLPLWVKSGHRSTSAQCPLYPKSGHPSARSACPLCANSRHSALRKEHRYSITSSARASSDCGTVSPSAFAVLAR